MVEKIPRVIPGEEYLYVSVKLQCVKMTNYYHVAGLLHTHTLHLVEGIGNTTKQSTDQ